MLTPYDWQEGISHRASYVEGRLQSGTPVIVVSVKEGILAYTMMRHMRKVYEIYDRLMFAAIGQQSDVEVIRTSALDFSHQEGFQRSEEDVTIQRVVAALSQPLKRAFSDFNSSPFVMQAIFAEVGDTIEEDSIYLLDYDGDYSRRPKFAFLSGTQEMSDRLYQALTDLTSKEITLAQAMKELPEIWAKALDPEAKPADLEEDKTHALTADVAIMERNPKGEARFRSITV